MKRTFIVGALAVTCGAQAQLWNNGPFSTGSTTRSGVAAPVGTTWSEVADGNTSAGASIHNITGAAPVKFRLADDFTVGAGGWNVSDIVVYAYQTGAGTAVSPILNGNLRIWNGRPGDLGSSIVFGDTTTNRLTSSVFTNVYRIFGTTNSFGGVVNAPGTTRPIYANRLSVGMILAPGTYWWDAQLSAVNNGTVFAPGITPPGGARTAPGYNARQINEAAAAPAWADVLDTGNPTTLADVPIDQAFLVNGTVVPEPATLAVLGIGALALARRRRK